MEKPNPHSFQCGSSFLPKCGSREPNQCGSGSCQTLPSLKVEFLHGKKYVKGHKTYHRRYENLYERLETKVDPCGSGSGYTTLKKLCRSPKKKWSEWMVEQFTSKNCLMSSSRTTFPFWANLARYSIRFSFMLLYMEMASTYRRIVQPTNISKEKGANFILWHGTVYGRVHGRRNFKDTNPLMSALLVNLLGVVKPGLRIRIHFIKIPIPIQHFRLTLNTNTDPDPIQIGRGENLA